MSNPDEPNTNIDIDIENGGQPEQDPANPDATPEDAGATTPAGETRTAERTGSGDAGADR